ncbi:hypothetical protein pCM2_0039 (plasmid) [Clavibacter michiganensis subsp. michiganensis NCPPB 382]|uniref:Uncharacterized protein n=1 Tax=Clavibacter michiganensis subsp. michiganensis (strain NCPPB 382) TaxID=443906 RepID=A5CLQ2_CLAM3|nr:hypothetical protein pCM2_0039 [Clavibacter michiganensis subsp. michiganensis NCPPB 382]
MLPTPPGVRRTLSSAMIGAAKSASDISSRLWLRDVRLGTPIAHLLGGKPLAESAFQDVTGSISTATDHVHALARVIRLPEEIGPSIATLSRGAIEAFGRGWWLLDVQDAASMEHRSAVMRLAEVTMAKKRGVKAGRLRGDGVLEDIDVDLAIAESKQYLAAVQIRDEPLSVPGYATLATAVMAAAGVSNPEMEYSHLSGAAHGENLTTRGFASVRHGIGTLGLPYRYLNMYAWTVLHTVDLVVTRLIELWDAGDERERWTFQRDRTYEDFETLRNFVVDYEPA